jgi:hypothetical protein
MEGKCSNKQHLLFRGQSKEVYDEPFTSSALRKNNIEFMEMELKQFGIEINEYKIRCKNGKILTQYNNSDENAFYAYWLSITNCAIAVNTNRICHNFCKSPFFHNNIYKNGSGVFGVATSEIGDICFNYAKDFFDSDKQNETLHIQWILHDYAFFQHINHVFSKLDGSGKYRSMFPTLAMDWTWEIDQAKKFAGSKGNVVSINFDAYKKWNPLRNFTVQKIIDEPERKGVLSKTPIFGFESYRDTETWNDNKTDWDSWDNNLMIEQKGAVIFWPWTFTIEQMRNNELGKALDFKKLK